MGRGSEIQLQVGENLSYLVNLRRIFINEIHHIKKTLFYVIIKCLTKNIAAIGTRRVSMLNARNYKVSRLNMIRYHE